VNCEKAEGDLTSDGFAMRK